MLRGEEIKCLTDTYPYELTLAQDRGLANVSIALRGELMHRLFWKGKTGNEFVMRPMDQFPKDPFIHYRVPPNLRWAERLKVGHMVRCRVAREKPPKDALWEMAMRQGRVTEIISINDLPSCVPYKFHRCQQPLKPRNTLCITQSRRTIKASTALTPLPLSNTMRGLISISDITSPRSIAILEILSKMSIIPSTSASGLPRKALRPKGIST